MTLYRHDSLDDDRLRGLISDGTITFGGNAVLKIYGTLSCASGRRMARRNRVFFRTEEAARAAGFRPCGHCMPAAYRAWKAGRTFDG